MRIPRILLVIACACAAAEAADARQRAGEEAGLTGVVLTPEGAHVSGGHVALIHGNDRVNAVIDREGGFRLVPQVAGQVALFVSVPGFAPYRVNVIVPSSRRMTLPAIQLLPATYFRARFVTPDGEVIAPSVRRRSVDANGAPIPEPLPRDADPIDGDGSLTMGPLPPGRTMLTFDRAPFAQMRLPDVPVTEKGGVVDRGTIVIQPGTELLVEVVSAAGVAVPRHTVWIEDALQPSGLFFSPGTTDENGRVAFGRLAAGRYRVWTRSAERCENQLLEIARLVSVGGSGTRVRLVVTGTRATFRFVWPPGALTGRVMRASPEVPSSTPPWLPMGVPGRQASCGALTDSEGRVVLAGLPPGATRVTVSLFNSMFSRVVTVPEDGREIVIEVPDGLLPVHVTNRDTTQPVGSARVIWKGSGGTVEALTNANGHALVEAVGSAGGTLGINARDYEEVEGSFDEAPATNQEVALKPLRRQLSIRVVADGGQPVPGAVIHRLPAAPSEPGEFAAADGKGQRLLVNIEPGPVSLSVTADGFAATVVQVSDDSRREIVVTLSKPGASR